MEKAVIKVDGMSCEHCVKTITKAVGALPGIAAVAVDLNAKTVTVDHDPGKTALEQIRLEIEDQGYDVVG
ncbi:MAG TPA: copper ion binding protein [Feifaniaceae bacterium]|nr:copper ion binding protein [Feifaniaceae bacterium]